ncbi:MAG: hypothetical protein WCG85_04160, partial [Polyangia bacterium]
MCIAIRFENRTLQRRPWADFRQTVVDRLSSIASSQRRAGVRRYYPNGSVVGDPATQTLLWMFALD